MTPFPTPLTPPLRGYVPCGGGGAAPPRLHHPGRRFVPKTTTAVEGRIPPLVASHMAAAHRRGVAAAPGRRRRPRGRVVGVSNTLDRKIVAGDNDGEEFRMRDDESRRESGGALKSLDAALVESSASRVITVRVRTGVEQPAAAGAAAAAARRHCAAAVASLAVVAVSMSAPPAALAVAPLAGDHRMAERVVDAFEVGRCKLTLA